MRIEDIGAFAGVVSKSSSKVEKTEEVRPGFPFPARSVAAIARLTPVWTDELRPLWCRDV